MAENLYEKRERLLAELAEIDAEEKRIGALTPQAALAETLHDLQCRWNHTDGCSWFYEIHNGVVDWNAYAHHKYLDIATRARDMLPTFTNDHIIQVAKVFKGLS